ncbi:MAG: DUF4198 domain-containing protein [Desulfobacteraceae bacterium]|jgi:uncharacterized GH25 family protein
MKTRKHTIILFCIFLLIILNTPAMAHNIWLNPGNYYPEVGTTVDIGIGWGHQYPASRIDQEFKEGRLGEIKAIDPDGLTVNLTKVSHDLYRLKVEKAGVYLLSANIKPVFFTNTPEGRKQGNKQTVDNCVKCTNYHIEAKTVIIAGGSEKGLESAMGRTLELIPLTGLKNLKKGGKLKVKALFEGKPLPGLQLKAGYAGFEDDIAPHDTAQKGKKNFPVETITDDQGQAVIQPDKAGYWIVMLSQHSPYPDKEECDEYTYNIAFTFEVGAGR